jgi:hypothetical protein
MYYGCHHVHDILVNGRGMDDCFDYPEGLKLPDMRLFTAIVAARMAVSLLIRFSEIKDAPR